jgi:hypothetical protein
MPVVHLVGEIPDLGIQVAKAINGQSACSKPVLATVFLDVPGYTMASGINVHKTGNYMSLSRPRCQRKVNACEPVGIGKIHGHVVSSDGE